jgi:hypothetical protein
MAFARTLLILTMLAVAPGAAVVAQETSPSPAPPGTLDAPPEQIEPGPPVGSPGSGETLGETLNETRGVIQPPQGVDPGIVEPTPSPQQFPTPVIPPGAVTPETQPR